MEALQCGMRDGDLMNQQPTVEPGPALRGLEFPHLMDPVRRIDRGAQVPYYICALKVTQRLTGRSIHCGPPRVHLFEL